MVEIKYGQLSAQKLGICQQSYSTSRTINKNNQLMIAGLQSDKVELVGLSNQFKERYIETNKQLSDCEVSKPSRLTWFGVGFLAATILGILGAFAISK